MMDRRGFLKTSAAALALPALSRAGIAIDPPETLVKTLYDSLTDAQKKEVAFPWEHLDKARGLLRCYLSNNWRITKPAIKSDFFTAAQQAVIRQIFEGIVNPDWIERFDRQMKDDLGGFGKAQSIALFGQPGQGKFEFVLGFRPCTEQERERDHKSYPKEYEPSRQNLEEHADLKSSIPSAIEGACMT